MDLISFLKRAPLSELINYADTEGIPLHSRLSEAITVADIARAKGVPPQVINRLNLDGGMIANEIGYLIKEYNRFLGTIKQLFDINGIDTRYLNMNDPFTYGVFCYERRIPLLPDLSAKLGDFWEYQVNFDLGPVEYRGYNYNSFQEYLEYNCLTSTAPAHKVLYYQSFENLLRFAETRPSKALYFKTFKGVITHIITVMKSSSEEIYNYFAQFHQIYPHRNALVTEYAHLLGRQNPITFTAISEIHTRGAMAILSLPPLRLEERLVQSQLTVSQDRELFLRVFPEMGTESEAGLLADQFFNICLLDFNLHPSRQDLVSLLEMKNPLAKRVSEFNLKKITGWGNPTAEEIKRNVSTPEFKRLYEPNCPNQRDSFYDPIQPPYISFGTFTEFICYNLNELEAAFARGEEGRISFQMPHNPGRSFTNKQLDQLVNILEKIPEARSLVEHINENRIPFIQEISNDPKVREAIIQFFKELFEAGMYQRRWKGPDHPYPMKYHQTREGSLIDVELDMTPSLSRAKHILEGLPPNIREDLSSLPSVEINLEMKTDTIGQLLNGIIAHNYCIGFANASLISSAYYYLQALHIPIPNFVFGDFEAKSTHRVGPGD